MKITSKFLIGIAILIILSPVGLILPEHFKAGSAWGEWGADEMQKLVGYVPKGLEKLSSLWKAPLSDYSFQGWDGSNLLQLGLAYLICAFIGVAAVVMIIRLITKK